MSIDRRRTSSGYLPLRDAIDHLFAGSVIMPDFLPSGSEGWPPTNLRVTDDDVVVWMAIPGANPDDIDVSVTGDSVTVSGAVSHVDSGPQTQGGKSGQPYFEEIWHGKFQRSFTLPVQVDANKVSAQFHNGILTLTLAKSEATKPRKIQVKPQQQAISGTARTSGSPQQEQGSLQTEKVPVQSGDSS